MIKKFRELFGRQKKAGKVVASPELPADHVHDCFELPCDMGRKVLRRCQTPGCDFMETVSATAAQQAEVEPLAQQVRSFQKGILDDVEKEVRRKGR